MMKAFFTITVLFIVVLIALSFADNRESDESITIEQFVKLYVDLSIATETFLDDSISLAQAQDSIFTAHEIRKSQFDSFRQKVDAEPEKWSEIWQKVVKILEQRDKEATKKKKIDAKKNR